MTRLSEREQVFEAMDSEHGEGSPDAVRGGFLGFVAHEMRNPLATALWSAELLARLTPEERGGARGEKLAAMALRALQRLRLLVEDHFLAERLDVEGIPLRVEPLRVREVVDAALAKAAAGDVKVDCDDALSVAADRTLLERALEGLVASAARGKTPVHLEAQRVGGEVAVRIAGAPIAADALAPPQKGTPSDTTGRGLALHMAQRVARALGGSLTVASDAFVLVVPAGAVDGASGGR